MADQFNTEPPTISPVTCLPLLMIDPPQLRRTDVAILAACWLAVSLPAVLIPHTPVGEEAAIVQAACDLSAARNTSAGLLLEATHPSRLTHPTLALRLSALASLFAGAEVLALRGFAIAAGLVTVLLSGDLAARWFGRRTGLLAGLVAATSAGLSSAVWYSGVAIWLAAATVVTFRLFSGIAFEGEPTEHRAHLRRSLARARSLWIAGLIGWLGFVASVLGAVEVGVVVVLPLGIYLIRQRREVMAEILRSSGWLLVALLAVASLQGLLPNWSPVAGSVGSLTEWVAGLADGSIRLERLSEMGRTVMPWGILIPVGLWLTRHEALAIRHSRERLLLCASLSAPLASVLLFPARPNLILGSCSLGSLSVAVALNRCWQVATTSQLRRRDTLIPAARIAFAAAALLCILSAFVGEWSRPELLDEHFLSRVASMRNEGAQLEIDVDVQDRLRVLSQLENHAGRETHNSNEASGPAVDSRLRVLVVSSPDRIADSTGRRPYRKLLESQHRAGRDDCLTLYEIEASPIAMRPREIR